MKNILIALEYIKNECISHSDVCKECTFMDIQGWCFFQTAYFEGKIPEDWDIDALSKKLKGEII